MNRLTISKILDICNPATITGPVPHQLGALCLDSRLVNPGDIFLAVRGPSQNGHDYIEAAIQNGATVIISETHLNHPDVFGISIADTRRVATRLALAERDNPEKKLKFIGVTGTNGKTTVSTLIYQSLQQLGYTCALIGTVEKRIGEDVFESKLTTPGALELAADLDLAARAGCHFVAMEVSSHALDQYRTEGIDFYVACFTNLTLDHLDYHGTIDSYAESKSRLFKSLGAYAHAVVNIDDEWSMAVTGDSSAHRWEIGFGETSGNALVENTARGIVVNMQGTIIQSPLVGLFNAYNVATAWAACVALGCSESNVATALSFANGAPGRMERVESAESGLNVFVDYAHTPDALENVLRTVSDMRTKGSITVVFGCGGNRDVTKRPKMGAIAAKYADTIVVTSDNPRNEDPERIIDNIMAGIADGNLIIRESDRRRAIALAIESASAGDIVLIAGKGHETYQEVKGVRHSMDDRLIASEAMAHKAASLIKEGR